MSRQAKRKKEIPQKSTLVSWDTIIMILSVGLIAVGIAGLFIVGPTKKATTTVQQKEELISNREAIDNIVTSDANAVARKISLYQTMFTETPDLLTKDDIEWMMKTDNEDLVTRAAFVLENRGEIERSMQIYKKIIETSQSSQLLDVAYEQITKYYLERKDTENAVHYLHQAIQQTSVDVYAHRWYGFWLQELMEVDRMDEASSIIDECFSRFRKTKFFPMHCYHQAGMVAMFNGELSSSIQYFLKLYREILGNWIDKEGKGCPALLVPLSIRTPYTAIEALRDEVIIDNDLQIDYKEKLPKKFCSTQKWPKIIHATRKDKIFEREVKEYDEVGYAKMGCFTNDEKKTVLYRIPDAVLQGQYGIITRKLEDGTCVQYVPGFPYLNSLAQPRYELVVPNSETDLPLVYIENALFLHFLDSNYYHFTIECITKIILAMEHPIFANVDNLRILATPTEIAEQYLGILNVLNLAEMYEPHKHRYQIENLYVIDWNFVPIESEDENSESIRVKDQHFEDYYVPSTKDLQYTRAILSSLISEDLYWEPRDYVVFLHRSVGSRTVADPLELYKSLSYIAEIHGLHFRLHGVGDTPIRNQIALFSRAVVVMGIHGAGFSNMIYCKPNTAIIELPVTPEKVSVYSRMASAFNFPYYTTPSTAFHHFQSIERFTNRMTIDTEETLYQALADLGYSYK